MNGNLRATWSRACFFDGRNAPELQRLELRNVVIAHNAHRLPWGIGLNLTTLVWTAPAHKHGSLVVSVSCFHHIVSSFPNLTTLELHEHVVGLEFATLENLEGSGVTPLTHIRDLRITGREERVPVRLGLRTVTLAMQALICLPKLFGWSTVLPSLEDLELECVDGSACAEWKTWCMGELELWNQWREAMANTGGESNVARVHMHMEIDEAPMGTDPDEGDFDVRDERT
ncbi:hypothetical protein J3R82DRAFT_2747 [Butyriboletus roseoflavus]|nr:hypothetical protein J3R82DRAFT_2747 [Butyriboletus roseoflavus]